MYRFIISWISRSTEARVSPNSRNVHSRELASEEYPRAWSFPNETFRGKDQESSKRPYKSLDRAVEFDNEAEGAASQAALTFEVAQEGR